jgi:hypothetical protein
VGLREHHAFLLASVMLQRCYQHVQLDQEVRSPWVGVEDHGELIVDLTVLCLRDREQRGDVPDGRVEQLVFNFDVNPSSLTKLSSNFRRFGP